MERDNILSLSLSLSLSSSDFISSLFFHNYGNVIIKVSQMIQQWKHYQALLLQEVENSVIIIYN